MKPFHFKQFEIQHHKSGHKVGTDGVLLGAWTSLVNNPNEILDIGSGTGLIALMMAQRSYAGTIDAIEINENAFEECVNNFENSIWNDRLFCYHGDVIELALEPDLEYDLIVCNPPFFKKPVKSTMDDRNQSRQQFTLSYESLIHAVKSLLSEKGEFSTIIPYSDHDEFIKLARNKKIFPFKITHVKGNEKTEAKRSLIQLCQNKNPIETNELILEVERHKYTEAYKALVKPFYLKV